jgi:putative spermidine/putrescine transport system permease protein
MRRNGCFSLLYHGLFITFMLAPLVVVIAVSFTSLGYISLPTHGLSLRWFRALAQADDFISALWLSLRLGALAASVAVVLAVPAALALTRYRFTGRGVLTSFFMSPLMIPYVVLGVAFLRFFTLAGFDGSFFWLALTHVIVVMPYALRLVLAAATGLERDGERAARSLGAHHLTAFRRVVLPALLPGIAGGWILAFITSFDELTMTVFVATPGTTTLPVAMYNDIAQNIDPLVTSISTLLIAGTVVLMIVLDRTVGLDRVLIGKG